MMMMMSVEHLVKWMAGETEVLVENLPLCPPQIPYDLTWVRTLAAMVGSLNLSYGTTHTFSKFKSTVFKVMWFVSLLLIHLGLNFFF
jgi:hypothetical protein